MTVDLTSVVVLASDAQWEVDEVEERSGRGRICDESEVRVLRLSRVDVLARTSCVHIQ